MHKFLLVGISMLLGIFAGAQFKITGNIADEFQNGLPDVHIQLNKAEYYSGVNGDYLITSLPEGSYTIIFDVTGYETFDTIVNVSQDLVLNISMKPQITYLQEARIEHSVADKEKTIAAHTLDEKTIEQFSGKSLGDALQEIEGVSALKTGSAIVKPIINGLHSSRVPVITNNTRLEDQEWGSEHAPNIDVNSASNIQVIKGANALQYGGDAVGGIVLINSESVPKKDTLYGKSLLTLNSNGRGGSISTSLTKGYSSGWFWDTTLTGKFMGDLESADYVLSNTGNREQNAFVQGGFKNLNNGIWITYSLFNAQTGILRASHIGNTKNLVNAINSHEPNYIADFTYDLDHPKQEVTHHLAQLNAYHKFSGWGKLNFQYAFQFNDRKKFDIRRGKYKNTPALDLDLTTHSANLDFESEKWNSWKFRSGISSLYQVNQPDPRTNVRPLIPDYDRFDLGAYAIADFESSPKFKFNFGARYDFSHVDAKKYYITSRWVERGYDEIFPYFVVEEFENQILTHPVYDFHNFSASFGLNFHPRHDYDFYLNASYVIRNPNPSELFSDGLHHSIATVELGDLSLNQEKALKFSVTAKHESQNFSWDISPYINYIHDFIQLVPYGLEYTVRGAFPVWDYIQSNAVIWGIDAGAEWNYTRNFKHHLTAAYLYGKDLENDIPLIDMPPFNFSNTISYRNEKWYGLQLALKNQTYLTQKKYPDNNFTVNLNVNGEMVPTYVDISTPPKGYSLFDFNASADLGSMLGWQKSGFTLGFSVENIFNTSYRNYLNHQRFYADETGRNFIIQLKINY